MSKKKKQWQQANSKLAKSRLERGQRSDSLKDDGDKGIYLEAYRVHRPFYYLCCFTQLKRGHHGQNRAQEKKEQPDLSAIAPYLADYQAEGLARCEKQ
ncbi:hypothetical protein [Yersinia aldovae]|uniref:hypothetical protein n=1 Tax=Yersinia aldovae TaxID=29483 RepID=UPI00142F2CA0|nr:hypothetical protein [Yersinia aldovae]